MKNELTGKAGLLIAIFLVFVFAVVHVHHHYFARLHHHLLHLAFSAVHFRLADAVDFLFLIFRLILLGGRVFAGVDSQRGAVVAVLAGTAGRSGVVLGRHFVAVAVHHVMSLEVDSLREAFAADGANEGPLAGMSHVMAHEATLLVKDFTTKVARELLPAIGRLDRRRRYQGGAGGWW